MEKVTELAAVIKSLEYDVAIKEEELRSAKNRLERTKTKHEVKTSKVHEDIEKFIEMLNSKNKCSYMHEFTYVGDVFTVYTLLRMRHNVYEVHVQSNPDVYLSEDQRDVMRITMSKKDQYPFSRYSRRFLFSFDA